MAPSRDTNGEFTETWLGKAPSPGVVAIAACSLGTAGQCVFVAGSDGSVRSLALGPPTWGWSWQSPITQHDNIRGLAAYFHSADARLHCFIAQADGAIWECSLASPTDRTSLNEIRLGALPNGGAPVALAGFSRSDGGQNLFVAGHDGLVWPLLLGSATNWQWSWHDPLMTSHDGIVGISSHHNVGDNSQHVFVILSGGDVWEAASIQGGPWKENWLGILDGGASSLAGHAASNDTQHVFAAGPPGWVLPLQMGPPHWKWRWDNRLMSRHDGIVGLASYYHPGDGQQHLIASLQVGDIWESRFTLRDRVATREWNPSEFPISYWVAPRSVGNASPNYQQVADVGITTATQDYASAVAENNELLAACGSAGLRMFVYDSRRDTFVKSGVPLTRETKAALEAMVADYSGHSALAGYFLADEVPTTGFSAIGAMVQYIRTLDPGHTCFAELYPQYTDESIYNPAKQPAVTYPGYVAECIDALRLPYVCFDNYAFQTDYAASFYLNLRIVRQAATSRGLPFWQFANSCDWQDQGMHPLPTEAELRAQAMQILAFGGKGVLWFTYWPAGGGNAIIDPTGNPSVIYDATKRVNQQVHVIGKALLSAQTTAVYESGIYSSGGTPPPPNGIVQLLTPADVTIGVFSVSTAPDSSSALKALIMVANRNSKATTYAKLRFSGTVQKLNKSTGAFEPWVPPRFSAREGLEFGPGEAELFQLLST